MGGNQHNPYTNPNIAIPSAEIAVFTDIVADTTSAVINTSGYNHWQFWMKMTSADPQASAQIIFKSKTTSGTDYAVIYEFTWQNGTAGNQYKSLLISDNFHDQTIVEFKELVNGCTFSMTTLGIEA